MLKKNSDKTTEQCCTKMKLKLDYRKIEDRHSRSGQGRLSWNQPATKPCASLDTLVHQEEAEVEEAEEEQGDTSLEQNSSSTTVLHRKRPKATFFNILCIYSVMGHGSGTNLTSN